MKDFDCNTERIDDVNEKLKIIQLKDGLTFGTDSYILSAFAKANPKGRAADLGAGVGTISLLCASKNKYAETVSFEIQKEVYGVLERNISLNGFEGIISPVLGDIRDAGLSREYNAYFDTVITNPPYMKSMSGLENGSSILNASRREENGTISDFASFASKILKFGGDFYTVYRPDRLADLIFAMKNCRLEPKEIVFVCPKRDSAPSLVLVHGKSGASSDVIIYRPLVIYDESGNYTEDFASVYDTFSLDKFLKTKG